MSGTELVFITASIGIVGWTVVLVYLYIFYRSMFGEDIDE